MRYFCGEALFRFVIYILSLRVVFCFFLVCLSFCSCHNAGKREAAGNAAAVAAFRQQLERIKATGEDSLVSAEVRALYGHAAPAIHNEVFPNTIEALGKILIFHTNADPGILPFYRNLYTEAALNHKNRAMAGIKLASYFAHIAQDPDSAGFYLQYAGQHPEVVGDTLEMKIASITAQICQLRGQTKEATEKLYRSIVLAEKLHDSITSAGGNINLANIYRSMQDYPNSIRFRKKALDYFRQKGDNASIANAAGGLGADYTDVGQIDSARVYYLEAEELFNKGAHSPVAQYYLYISKAGMYVTLEKFDSSVLYFDKAKAMLPLFNDPSQKQIFNITSAIAYTHLRDMHREAAEIRSYIPQLMADSDYQHAAAAYYSLYNIALTQEPAAQGTALGYYQLYDSVKAILSDRKNREYAAEMESKYESQQKNLKILTQQKELGRKRALNWILALSVLGLVLLAGILIARQQLLRSRREASMQQQFTRRLLKNTEEERGRIAGELHDGISHELLSLKNKLPLDVAGAEAKINSIISDVRMLSRNLHPVMLDKIGLKYSVEHLCEQMMAGEKLFASAEIDYDHQLPPADELQLYRIIQESLSNVLKYADAHAAKVTIHPKDSGLLVTVEDNGKGFDVSEQLQSVRAFGLHSMIQRGKALGGRTTITSSAQGTTIHLEIPLKNGHRNYSR